MYGSFKYSLLFFCSSLSFASTFSKLRNIPDGCWVSSNIDGTQFHWLYFPRIAVSFSLFNILFYIFHLILFFALIFFKIRIWIYFPLSRLHSFNLFHHFSIFLSLSFASNLFFFCPAFFTFFFHILVFLLFNQFSFTIFHQFSLAYFSSV